MRPKQLACWALHFVLASAQVQLALDPFHLEVEDQEVGILQPLDAGEELSNLSLHGVVASLLRLELQVRLPPADGQTQALVQLTEKGKEVFTLLWSSQDRFVVQQLGEEILLTVGSSLLGTAICTLQIDITPVGQVDVSLETMKFPSAQLLVKELPNLQLHVGRAVRKREGEVDFLGHIFKVKVWRGAEAPVIHKRRPLSCPDLHMPLWSKLRSTALQVLHCAFSSGCSLQQPPMRYLLEHSDEILDREAEAYNEMLVQCPMGFALAYAALFFVSYLGADPDPVLATGNMRFAAKYLELPKKLTRFEAMFGGTRPLRWLSFFGFHARRRLRDIINMPAEGAVPSSPAGAWRRGNRSHDVEDFPRTFASRLCIEIIHEDNELQILRNCVESMATAGLLQSGPFLVIRLTNGCGGPWSDPQSPEGWYLSWLQQRFPSTVACNAEAPGFPPPGRDFLLHLPSRWHLLPFAPSTVWKTLAEAAQLLEGDSQVVAVSMMEKFKQGLSPLGFRGGVLNRQKDQPDARDWKNFLRIAPALSPDWNLTEAEGLLTDLYNMFAETTGPRTSRWSMDEPLQAVRQCSGMICAPRSWWKEELDTLADSRDVWLLKPRRKGSDGEWVALSSGLFQQSRGSSYEYVPDAKQALGIPPCVACHLQSPQVHGLPAASPPFTLYFAVVDCIGVCRELFGNLISDALEAVQLASFQGPEVVLVEPLISNAVRRILTETEAEKFQKDRNVTGVYSFYMQEAMCTAQFEGTTPLGDIFDWPALVQWLVEARGIRGQISWEDFLQKTGGTIDMLTMQNDHYDGETRLPCADSQEETVLRFYQTHMRVRQRVCVQSKDHIQGFELRFLDGSRFENAIHSAVSSAKAAGRNFATVGLYLYWIEGAERARLHPGRYGLLSSHVFYTSMWRGMRFSEKILQRAERVARQLGLLVGHGRLESARRPFMATHLRKGDLLTGPAPRRLVQAKLGEPENIAPLLRRLLREKNLDKLFIMTNARPEVVQRLRNELNGTAELLQAPILQGGHLNHQRQLVVEMAIASMADYFLAFGDGLIKGYVSKPSLLTLQMRLHAAALPLESNGFAFADTEEYFATDMLGL